MMKNKSGVVFAGLITSVVLTSPGQAIAQCPGDLNDDGMVDPVDLATLLGSWGSCAECEFDEDCEAGEVCIDQSCVLTCGQDIDCDDGLFCNGFEDCAEFLCEPGIEPCAPDELCDEDGDSCIPPDGQVFRLGKGTDVFTGTSADDIFDANLFLAPGGSFIQTLNNADELDGAGGIDSLIVQFLGGLTTAPASLIGIEVLHLQVWDNNNTTLSALNADSITAIHNNNSTADLHITNLATAPTTIEMKDTTQNFTITVNGSVLEGGADEITLTLRSVTSSDGEPVVTLQPSTFGSGFETINLISDGIVPNHLNDLQDGVGNSFHTLNISGDQDIRIENVLGESVATVDCTAATGDVYVSLPPNDTLALGGSGDDTFDFSVVAGNFGPKDIVGGGDGMDTLCVDDGDVIGTTAVQPNVGNIETIHTATVLGGNLNVKHFGAVNATLAGSDSTVRMVTMASGGILKLTADTGEDIMVMASPNTAADILNLELVANFDTVGTDALLANSFEHIVIEAKEAARTLGGAVTLNNVPGEQSVTLIGSHSLTFDGLIIADSIDASALSGSAGITMNAAVGGGPVTVTGSNNADTITGGTGNDLLSAGGGSDTINIRAGFDFVTGGAGNDAFVFIDAADDTTNDAGRNTITDFSFGATSDTMTFDVSGLGTLAGGVQNPVTLANYFEGAIAGMMAGTAYSVVVITDQSYADFGTMEAALSAQSTSATDGIVVFFNTTSGQCEIYVDSDLSADNNIIAGDQIVTLDNIKVLVGMSQLANTDFIFGA